MTTARIIGVVVATLGVVLIIWGAVLPPGAGGEVRQLEEAAATGADLTLWIVVGGVVATLVGGALILFGPRKALG